MNALSPWALAAGVTIAGDRANIQPSHTLGKVCFTTHLATDSFWLISDLNGGGRIAFRLAYSWGTELQLVSTSTGNNELHFTLESPAGSYEVAIHLGSANEEYIKYTTSFTPVKELFVPFTPRDIVITGKNGKPENTAGKIHTSQTGTRSGLVYFSLTRPKSGSMMYIQNLSALGDYCQETENSCGEVVGGQWPELGFALPPALKKPLPAGRKFVVSDAIIHFSDQIPDTENAMVEQYLDLLAKSYLQLPKPQTNYNDWPKILDLGLKDLMESPGCWSQLDGNKYFNAYVSDYDTPPEIMVQLAVMLPLVDYTEWSGKSLDTIEDIRKGLSTFFDEQLGVIKRWHPKAEDKLKGEEEQKFPDVMDSWYLHHPLLNLSRLALKGDGLAEKIFLDSLEYTVKVAKHFNYNWPVFYKMDTLEVVKAETKPGEGGEKDVAGIYSLVMLQAYELTRESKFLKEAEKAANTLKGLGFDLLYQANNTSFAAGALLRLHKLTGKPNYLKLSNLCIANLFNNVQMWECNYGYGRYFSSFFGIFPLQDAPYTAVYEEVEVFAALHDYLSHASDVDILPSVKLLCAEYIRYLVSRAVNYYPPSLPEEMLATEVKVGELDPKLWIALEDMQDGWEQCGKVGQEVYGAGNAFGILPRHFIRIEDENFMIFCDYPKGQVTRRKNYISFRVLGDARLTCRLAIVSEGKAKLPGVEVQTEDKSAKAEKTGNRIEFEIRGDQLVKIRWK